MAKTQEQIDKLVSRGILTLEEGARQVVALEKSESERAEQAAREYVSQHLEAYREAKDKWVEIHSFVESRDDLPQSEGFVDMMDEFVDALMPQNG